MTPTRTYLDHNASSPLRGAARAAMLDALEATGNPSSVHGEGRRVRAIIDTAREQVAALVGAKPSEVVFTSGATEANNVVMAGGWKAICVSAIEHDSVLAPARASGAKVIALPAGAEGIVDLQQVAGSLAHAASGGARTLLSVMLANNETGVVQPVAEAAALAREHGLSLHVDAVQGPGRLPINFAALGADTLVISAHKLGGPRGVGALIVRDGVNLPSFIKGGGQERRRRGGTENVGGIAGFGAAAAEVAREDAVLRMQALRDKLEAGVMAATPNAVIVGHGATRIANTSCIAVSGRPAETIVIKLDLHGVAVSAGAACSSGKVGANSVLEAMGLGPEAARSSVRISLGPQTGDDDIAAFLAAWEKIAGRAALAA